MIPGPRFGLAVFLTIGLTCLAVAVANTPPLRDTPPTVTTKMPEESRVRILQAQLKEEQLKSQFAQLQLQMSNLQTQYADTQKELESAKAEAFTRAKLDPKEWTINLDKVEFVAAPKPAPTPAKTEEPKKP